MTFSIVTVTYNCKSILEKTINSVVDQSYKDYEYIIVDGFSTDGTVDIIKARNVVSIWVSEKDRGIYDAMNKGISMAKGDYVILLNSGDNFSDNSVLQRVANFIEQNQDVDIVYGDILVESKKGLVVKVADEPCNKHRMYFCHQSAFVKTEISKENLYAINFKMSADFDFFKGCFLKSKKFMHMNIVVAVYDKNGISNTQRVSGLKENIRVILNRDRYPNKLLFAVKLYFVIFLLKIRRKK